VSSLHDANRSLFDQTREEDEEKRRKRMYYSGLNIIQTSRGRGEQLG